MIAGIYSTVDLLSEILEQVAIGLQLTGTQVGRAQQSYRGATTWLAAIESALNRLDPHLFPQGSLALDTTVRPIHRNEFDLDVVCLIRHDSDWTPKFVYELIWDRLAQHGTYCKLMESKPRCIRLNYASDAQFHLDVVPAIPDYIRGGSAILIPDGSIHRGPMSWKESDPLAFRRWFEHRKIISATKAFRAQIDPLDEPLPAEQKSILTKCVQLVKRWRDVRWQADQENATPSIVLTFLAAALYRGEGSITEALTGILRGLVRFVESGVRDIYNPVNDEELISEKWHRNPESYASFVRGILEFEATWSRLLSIAQDPRQGAHALVGDLKTLFGEPAGKAVASLNGPVGKAREENRLLVEKSSGLLAPSAVAAASSRNFTPYRPQTFHGD